MYRDSTSFSGYVLMYGRCSNLDATACTVQPYDRASSNLAQKESISCHVVRDDHPNICSNVGNYDARKFTRTEQNTSAFCHGWGMMRSCCCEGDSDAGREKVEEMEVPVETGGNSNNNFQRANKFVVFSRSNPSRIRAFCV